MLPHGRPSRRNSFRQQPRQRKPRAPSRPASTLSNLELFAAARETNSEIPAVLERVAQTFEMLLPLYYTDAAICSNFVQTFRSEASKYDSIERELGYLASDHAAVCTAVSTLPHRAPTPKIDLVLGAPELCEPPLIPAVSAVTHSTTGGGRQITIYLKSDSLDFESYFKIPSLLSHEFWCHALANLANLTPGQERSTWRGCDPQNPWEEGWMDFVQNLILRASDFPLPPGHLPCLTPPLYRASTLNEVLRADPANGIQRAAGWNSAMFVMSFFRQYYSRFRPDDLLIDLSLKLNAINELPEKKTRVVAFFRKYLAPPDFGADAAVSYDRNMVGRRNELFRLLAPVLDFRADGRSVSIDVAKLLKIVENISPADDIFKKS